MADVDAELHALDDMRENTSKETPRRALVNKLRQLDDTKGMVESKSSEFRT